MKRICISILCLLSLFNLYSQSERNTNTRRNIFGDTGIRNNKHQPKKNITKDRDGYLFYEDNRGRKASLKKNIFDDWIYTDNNKNEAKFSKEFWKDIVNDFGNSNRAFIWLIDKFHDANNFKEEYKIDIFGYHQYQNSERKKATLKKDIFDAWIYSDSNRNEAKFSQEYWSDIFKEFGDNTSIFMTLMDMFGNMQSFKEEYKIDIFGHQQYENSNREKASLKKDIFDDITYEDTKKNKIKYSEREWNRFAKRYGSDKRAFMSLIQEYLF